MIITHIKTDKDIRYRAFVVTMAFRCNYIEPNPLTFKGWGYLPFPKLWIMYNELLCRFSKRYRKEIREVLDNVTKYNDPFKITKDDN